MKKTKENVVPFKTEEERSQVRLTLTKRAHSVLTREAKAGDSKIFNALDAAHKELMDQNPKLVTLLYRLIFQAGDVQRTSPHILLGELGIKKWDAAGDGMRHNFRSAMRWILKTDKKWFYDNLRLFAQYTNYGNLWFYELQTSVKGQRKGRGRIQRSMVSVEHTPVNVKKVAKFIGKLIRKRTDLYYIARFLPKLDTSTTSVTEKTMKAIGDKKSFQYKVFKNAAWIKVNGELKDIPADRMITVKDGDVVRFPRIKRAETLARQNWNKQLIEAVCEEMGWSWVDKGNYKVNEKYNKFRSTHMAQTPEHIFSSGKVLDMNKAEFFGMLDSMTSANRAKVSRSVCYKDTQDTLQAKEGKYNKLGTWYREWFAGQTQHAQKIREAQAKGDKAEEKRLSKQSKIKTVGTKSIDLLMDLIKGTKTSTDLDTTFTNFCARINNEVPVHVVVDDSGSMRAKVHSNLGVNISAIDLATVIALTFLQTNPPNEFDGCMGIFATAARIAGYTHIQDSRPNRYMHRRAYQELTKKQPIINKTEGFVAQLKKLRGQLSMDGGSTNMGAYFDMLISGVKDGRYTVEDLPPVLLFITDGEWNTGRSPQQCLDELAKYGYEPLVVYWLLSARHDVEDRKFADVPNCLLMGGLNESSLTNILQFIEKGYVNPNDALWAIYDNPRFSPVK
jgi:hypothetical protein